MPTPYHPPFTITPRQLTLVGEICERIGHWSALDFSLSPQLRKTNRIQSIQASLEIEERIELIHPFSDGNGRLGRLWQSLSLSRWHAALAYLPVESLVRDRQAEYYAALGAADRQAEATPFVEFMLMIIKETLDTSPGSDQVGDQVSDQVSDQVKSLLSVIEKGEILAAAELMARLGLKHLPSFRQNYLKPALAARLFQMTQPDSPNSPTQRYRLTSHNRDKRKP